MLQLARAIFTLQGFREEGGQKVAYNTMLYSESEVRHHQSSLHCSVLPSGWFPTALRVPAGRADSSCGLPISTEAKQEVVLSRKIKCLGDIAAVEGGRHQNCSRLSRCRAESHVRDPLDRRFHYGVNFSCSTSSHSQNHVGEIVITSN